MTLNDLLIDCCTRLNYAPDLTQVDAKVQARLTAFLNQTQLEILGQPSYARLLRTQFSFDTVTGQAMYGMPMLLERIVSIVDRQNQLRLGVMSLDAYRRYMPDPSRQQGTVEAYAFDGWSAVQQQPARGETLAVFAQSSDSGTVLTCRYLVTTGTGLPALETTSSVVLDSTAPNGVSIAVDATWIVELSLDKPVLASQADIGSGIAPVTNTRFVARLPKGTQRTRYATVHLVPTPGSPITLDVFGERAVSPFVSPSDESVVPPRFHYVLAAGARMKEYELRGDNARLAQAQREYSVGLGYLNAWVSDQPDASDYTVPDDGRHGGQSVLGPWFPASSYRDSRW